MSPQWIPQNIQKRLLLYVLQQLSLFSEIDLPNLEEVSLNNIVLRNVAIDPEKVGKLPGCNLRYGQIGSLELNTISGISGVKIDLDDVEIVISPDFDIDEDIANHVAFSLAQSTADLANTIMLDSEEDYGDLEGVINNEAVLDDEEEEEEGSDEVKSKAKTRKNSSVSNNKPSALGGVMQRAVEMALSRLQINITNLKIKLVTELTDLLIEVDSININSTNGTRAVTILGTRLKTLKPHVNPGEVDEKPSSETETTTVPANDTTDDDDDDNTDEDDYGNESLMDSMVFTHEEASSIYMSATSQSFEKSTTSQNIDGVDNKATDTQKENKEPPIIFYMNECSVEFDGLSNISNLEVEVDTVNLAFTPLTPTLISIFKGVTKSLKIKYYQKKKQAKSKLSQRNDKFPQYADENDDVAEDDAANDDGSSSDPFFNKLKVNNFIISATSALNQNGEFTSNKGINIIFSNINVKQKNELLLYGGIEAVKIVRIDDENIFEIFQFENQNLSSSSSSTVNTTTKADVRFEVFKKSEDTEDLEVTVLMAKSAKFSLDLQSLLILTNFLKAMGSIYEEYNSLKAVIDKWGSEISRLENKINDTTKKAVEHQFILQTASIFMNTIVSPDLSLQLIVFPIKFNLLQDQLIISKILLNCIQDNISEEGIITITDITLSTKIKDFKTFLQSNTSGNSHALPRQATISSKMDLSIQKILMNLSMEKLKFIGDKVKCFLNEFTEKSPIQSNSLENSFVEEPFKKTSRFDGSLSMASSMPYPGSRRTGRRMGLGLNNSPSLFLGASTRFNLASFQVSIKDIIINITNVFPKFGDLKISLSDIIFYQLKQDFLGHVLSVGIERRKDDLIESVLHQYQDTPIDKLKFPLLIIKCKTNEKVNKIEITGRNLLLEYYTNWLLLMNNDDSIIDAMEEEIIEKVTPSFNSSNPNKFDIRYTVYDCMIGLTPGRLNCKSYLLIGKGNSDLSFGTHQFYIKCSFRDLSLILIDDMKNCVVNNDDDKSPPSQVPYGYVEPLEYYLRSGFIQVGSVNVAHVGITFNTDIEELRKRNEKLGIKDNISLVDLKINSDEHQVYLCADSANTLIQLINDLKLPLNFRDEDKMRVTVPDSINITENIDTNMFKDLEEEFTELVLDEQGNPSESSSQEASSLVFEEEHFEKNTRSIYETGHVDPLRININLSQTNIYLHDGYDWKDTRKAIRGTVKKFETQHKQQQQKSDEEHAKPQVQFEDTPIDEDGGDDNTAFEETLFQSIHITAPRQTNPVDMAASINQQIQNDTEIQDIDKYEENVNDGKTYKNLKLRRSVKHKILIDLKNIEVGVVVFSTRDPRKDKTDPSMPYELLNSVDVRVGTVDVYDNVPTSTWNKFLSYMNILGEREIGTSMVKVSILNVRPDPSLVAGEAIMDVSVLPLRLHIDQDTLEFLMRFGEFSDERFQLPPDEPLYLQQFSISSIKVKMDYKPKKRDIVGLRSVNLFILDGSSITLPKVKLYGLAGVPKIGVGLGNAYLPVFQSSQVIGIISGISPLRSLVNIGGGFKDLIAIPINEYKKDGRLWRSLRKGGVAFAKTTGYELLNLGVKLASGTQVLLEQGEEMFGGEGSSSRTPTANMRNRGNSDASEKSLPTIDEIADRNLLQSSQILNNASAKLANHDILNKKLYSNLELDEDDYRVNGIDKELLSKSIFLLAPSEQQKNNGKSDEEEYDIFAVENAEELQEKMISLYGHQPTTVEDGLKQGYKSFNKNLQITKEEFIKLKNKLDSTDNFQDSLVMVLKNSPVILLRPIIGSTEATARILMGIANKIDETNLVELQDKYKE
ncbi:hypothetical protein G210_1654 [Candida maltosa Xu316]|uniref:Autophagy-related protein 2 n=1 Tax=Candida maltosa (strain Xu316) TaxID=1245528 RepID=M3K619_CANMX|nr:hypothetical protein G210_1654 [Candida maltosa Xu316]